jgi:hypothetical protein
MSFRFPALAICAFTFAAPALANTDGMLGLTSSGTFNVQATIYPTGTDFVQVYDLDDFSFMGTEGNGFMSQTQSFCVIRQTGGQVGLTVSASSGMDMDFRIKDLMIMSSIPVTFSVAVNNGMATQLGYNMEQVYNAPDQCNPMSMSYSSLQVDVPGASMAPAGYYSNSFTVTVAPK